MTLLGEEVAENVAYRTPEAQAMADFVAKRVKATSTRGTLDEVELSDRIGEIEEETQIKGTDYLKLHIIDPDWTLQNSGFVDVDSDGLLDEIEVEFPAGSKRYWVFCGIEGSTDVAEANFIMTFQDKLFARLRSEWGVKNVPPGTQTRARFVHDLLVEADVPAVIPGIGILQPIEEETKGEAGQAAIETATSKTQKHAEINKSADTGKLARAQYEFAAELATVTGLDAKVVAAWCLAEESGSAATGRENEHNNNWLNIGYFDSGPGQIAFDTAFNAPKTGAEQTAKFLKGEWGGASSGILSILKSIGQGPSAQIAAIASSGWASSGYEGGQSLRTLYGEIGGAETPTATGGAEEAKSDVGQLKRGTDGNPDEDSAECIERLAQQVDWFGFSDGRRFYYMDGPELAKQTPCLRVGIPRNHIVTRDGVSEYGAIVSPSTYTFDDTAFEYRLTHKIKTRTQRRSRAVKPSSPSEVKLDLICKIGQYVAGQVIAFKNSGTISSIGRWVIVQTTRKCMKDIFTEILCEPPLEPLPEPKETSKEEVSTAEGEGAVGGASEQAKRALSERSKYQYSEGPDRGNNGTLYGPEPRTMDCSSFVTLCYKAASLPDPSNQDYNPIGATGSLIANCEKVSTPTKDDLCFFGPSESETVHVTIYVGGGKAIAMQAPGITLGEGDAPTFGPGNFLGYYRPKNY